MFFYDWIKALWPNWLNVFRSLKKIRSTTEKNRLVATLKHSILCRSLVSNSPISTLTRRPTPSSTTCRVLMRCQSTSIWSKCNRKWRLLAISLLSLSASKRFVAALLEAAAFNLMKTCRRSYCCEVFFRMVCYEPLDF